MARNQYLFSDTEIMLVRTITYCEEENCNCVGQWDTFNKEVSKEDLTNLPNSKYVEVGGLEESELLHTRREIY